MKNDYPFPVDLHSTWQFFLRLIEIIRGYCKEFLRPNFIAFSTLAIIMLPQAIAFAMIAELPPQMGLYMEIAGSFVAELGDPLSNRIHARPIPLHDCFFRPCFWMPARKPMNTYWLQGY